MWSLESQEGLVLGIDGGGSTTRWALADLPSKEGKSLRVIQRGQLPRALNICRLSDEQLKDCVQAVKASLAEAHQEQCSAVGIFAAGCLTLSDRRRLEAAVKSVFGSKTFTVTGGDAEAALEAAFLDEESSGREILQILVIAGTGSNVLGRRRSNSSDSQRQQDAELFKGGGAGCILGDKGSAYWITRRALKAAFIQTLAPGDPLASLFHRDLCSNSPSEVIAWTTAASRRDLADLCPLVFEGFTRGSTACRLVLTKGAAHLAKQVRDVVLRITSKSSAEVRIRLTGSVFQKQPSYVEFFRAALEALHIPSKSLQMSLSAYDAAEGAALLALKGYTTIEHRTFGIKGSTFSSPGPLVEMTKARTEQRNPRSAHLGDMQPAEIVSLFLNEERYVTEALQEIAAELEQGIKLVHGQLAQGGRLFYIGAGTSGRLGVLDASEIPPTFGEPSETVQGIIAGGLKALYKSVEGAEDSWLGGRDAVKQRGVLDASEIPPTFGEPSETVQGIIAGGLKALYKSVEGAEDSWLEGRDAVKQRGLTPKDILVGLTASGRTPFVLGGLEEGNAVSCPTVLVTCNPDRPKKLQCSLHIDIPTGPELVTGSTRLKAGTATKICINILSTGAMVLLGRVHGNLMVKLKASNLKLEDRAARTVAQEAKLSYDQAREILIQMNWDVADTLQALQQQNLTG
ncbi:unnamed protein product [Cyprideis torosa]|uniref:N-acetyl-D-glucosamine kinase n=1 Tax=Cyprideis torosa TaxID=163714 RepID=A0A7R8W1R7_9CRUS|nr:unnamed protein product [Cyprideis torosa]CAG0881234.1 unnamed protein product [Cyprideis torosa]